MNSLINVFRSMHTIPSKIQIFHTAFVDTCHGILVIWTNGESLLYKNSISNCHLVLITIVIISESIRAWVAIKFPIRLRSCFEFRFN